MIDNTKDTGDRDSKSAGQFYHTRERRILDAIHLKQPDRIPIMLPLGYMLAEIGGITKQELLENSDKTQLLLEKACMEFQPDSAAGVFPSDPRPYLQMGSRMTLFPGHGLDPDSEYQFVEKEFMKGEDYDEFLEDPADWAMRVYLPRVFSMMEGFSILPPLGMFLSGSYNLLNLGIFTAPPLAASFHTIARVAQAAAEIIDRGVSSNRRMIELGFIPHFTANAIYVQSPFDFMSDTLRGMRGIMLDIFKRPDKLLAAEEKVSRFQLKYALDMSRSSGMKDCFIALHRGSDGFMSLPHFDKFYWPQLKNMILKLVENNITPYVFYEGAWDKRLHYLTELPRAKTVGWFQSSDIFKVKEIVGDKMCIIGGMPNSMLISGNIEEVRNHTRKLCLIAGQGGGFIMSTSVGEMSGSRPELVNSWINATREYGLYGR